MENKTENKSENANKEILLKVENLKMYYDTEVGKAQAIDDISFTLNYGETLGLVGESGCGKTSLGTSLLKIPPKPGKFFGGKIILENENILELKEEYIRKNIRFSKVSMVFQGAMNSLTPVYKIEELMYETLKEHIDVADKSLATTISMSSNEVSLHKKNIDKQKAREIMEEYIQATGLSKEVLKMYPHELSGGMKQRVVIALALFLKPKLVILDEPTTALDVIVQAEIINLLKRLKKEFNLSFIFITHDLALEAEIADKIAVMYAGQIVEICSNEKLYGKAEKNHPYTKRLLLATPRLNKSKESLEFIEGTPPNLINIKEGCRFFERCKERKDICKNETPTFREIEKEHFCMCHLL